MSRVLVVQGHDNRFCYFFFPTTDIPTFTFSRQFSRQQLKILFQALVTAFTWSYELLNFCCIWTYHDCKLLKALKTWPHYRWWNKLWNPKIELNISGYCPRHPGVRQQPSREARGDHRRPQDRGQDSQEPDWQDHALHDGRTQGLKFENSYLLFLFNKDKPKKPKIPKKPPVCHNFLFQLPPPWVCVSKLIPNKVAARLHVWKPKPKSKKITKPFKRNQKMCVTVCVSFVLFIFVWVNNILELKKKL